MAAHQSVPSDDALPSELEVAVAVHAARDADHVCRFLDRLGLPATPEKPRPMPAGFLLDLGAALRLLAWEVQGIFIHREAGAARGSRSDPECVSVRQRSGRGPGRTLGPGVAPLRRAVRL